ncbi:MAG: pentapeptide repeat-containing protein [Pseudomonadota bacterium]
MLKHFAASTLLLTLSALPAAAQDSAAVEKVKAGQACPGCNLFQANLSYRDGQNLDLSSARLRQSNLSLGTFDGVNLSNADLAFANLFGARFNRANFTQANLQNATAVGTFFGASSFAGADLSGANLSGADLKIARGLTQAQLDTACGDASTQLPAGKTIPRCA